jgi:hypothetical protein
MSLLARSGRPAHLPDGSVRRGVYRRVPEADYQADDSGGVRCGWAPSRAVAGCRGRRAPPRAQSNLPTSRTLEHHVLRMTSEPALRAVCNAGCFDQRPKPTGSTLPSSLGTCDVPSATDPSSVDARKSPVGLAAPHPSMKLSRTVRSALSAFGSSRQTDCHVPRASRPPITGSVSDGDASNGTT